MLQCAFMQEPAGLWMLILMKMPVCLQSAGCLGSYCVRDERAERRRVSVGPFDDWWGFGFESVSETESRSLSSYMATLHITLIMNRFDRQLKVFILVEASDFLLEA